MAVHHCNSSPPLHLHLHTPSIGILVHARRAETRLWCAVNGVALLGGHVSELRLDLQVRGLPYRGWWGVKMQ